jgi:membrane associated rhomboid family serine protease
MAFLQSRPPREPFLHAPGSVLGLIGGLVAIHLAVTFIPIPFDALVPYVFIPARYVSPYLEHAPTLELVLPLVSHMFLHGSFVHLFVNCAWLLAFGPVVARRLGGLAFFVFFLASGVAGALMELALTWGAPEAMIGASGGISGLMAAGFRMMRWPGVPSSVRLAPIFSRPILAFSGLWLVTNLIFGLTGFGTDGQIAWQAHMGGYLFGLVAIGLFDRRRSAA